MNVSAQEQSRRHPVTAAVAGLPCYCHSGGGVALPDSKTQRHQFGTMACSKPCTESLMIAAMAYRVKYRQYDAEGRVIKKLMGIGFLGVHPKNRGGVYPAGVRCKSLTSDLFEVGFLKEEINHAVVGVEETPTNLIPGRVPTYVNGSEHNIEKT